MFTMKKTEVYWRNKLYMPRRKRRQKHKRQRAVAAPVWSSGVTSRENRDGTDSIVMVKPSILNTIKNPQNVGKKDLISAEKPTSLLKFLEVQWLVMATIPFLSIRHRRVTSRVPWPPSTNTVFPSKETSEKWFNLTLGHYSGKRNCWNPMYSWPLTPALWNQEAVSN